MSVAAVDIGTRNHAVGFYNEAQKYIDLIKVDLLQQKDPTTGFYKVIKYEEKHAVKIIRDFVDGTWDNYWSYIKYTAIEFSMYGFFDGKRMQGDKVYALFSRILYAVLEERGICCFIVTENKVREDLGTQLLEHEQTGNKNKDRLLRKQKSIVKFRELVGESALEQIRKQFGKEDDVVEAFLLTMWTKEHLAELIKAKRPKFKWLKTPPPKRFLKIQFPIELYSAEYTHRPVPVSHIASQTVQKTKKRRIINKKPTKKRIKRS